MTLHRSIRYALLTLVVVLLGQVVGARPATAAPPPLDEARILIVGLEPRPEPVSQVAPRHTGTIVTPLLVRSDGATEGEVPALPPDALFLAELRGPAFGTAVALAARPNEPFIIPPLPLAGRYTLSNIRLASGGQTLLQANPDVAEIEVIDKVLVSNVTSRPLTAAEIQERGIVLDQSNYKVVNFTVAFGLEGERVTVEFPMILPANEQSGTIPGYPVFNFPRLSPVEPPQGVLPGLDRVVNVPNIAVSGFSLRVPDEVSQVPGLVDAIPGVVIIPGNVAYLNQFFSVLLKVSNVAPGYSSLVVSDLQAKIVLPPGSDGVPGSGDDPLRMARLGDPPAPQPTTQPVTRPGPDGVLGTADDISRLTPGESGDAEFLVEGRRQGMHTVDIEITATLGGLPGGPVPLRGMARGMVEVRDPTFALTFNHPATVSANEPYDFNVTVTNISESPANFVSLSLLPNSISGATLLSDPVQQIETIPAGDSATVTFRLSAQRAGNVTSSAFDSEGVAGRFELRTAVGELGIPMSPNTLVLPPPAAFLPPDLYRAALDLLGQAYALGSAPTTPPGLLPMGTGIVYDRASELAAAGQRVQLGEPLPDMARDLALDFLGNGFSRLAERYPAPLDAPPAGQQSALQKAEQEVRGFDALLRQSSRGAAFLARVAADWDESIAARGVVTFTHDLAAAAASRPGHLSAIVGAGHGSAPVVLTLSDPSGKRLGIPAPGEALRQEIPFGGFFSLLSEAPRFSQLALVASPVAGAHLIEVVGTATGTFDLALVVPEPDGLHHVAFIGVPTRAGLHGRVSVTVGGANSYQLLIDSDGDGVDEALEPTTQTLVADTGPRLISATQIVTGKKDGTQYGQVVGLLFSEEVTPDSAQHHARPEQISRYTVENNLVQGVALQPGGRVVLIGLRDGIGRVIPRGITVRDIQDRGGIPVAPMATPLPISPASNLPGGGTLAGTVRQADGSAVPFAQIALYHIEDERNPYTGERYEDLVTVKSAGEDGRYSFDYLRMLDTRVEFYNAQSGEQGRAFPRIRFDGQQMEMDLILIGTGTVTGRVLAADGVTPLPGAVVRVVNPLNSQVSYVVNADSSGAYVVPRVPVGPISIEAVHVASNARTLLASLIQAAGQTVVQDLTLYPLTSEFPRGAIEGVVVRADGITPAVGIPVYSALGGVATTDEDGFYRIEGLPAGSVVVQAVDQLQLESGSVSSTIVADQSTTANIILRGGSATITGRVQEADGAPLEGVAIYGGPTLLLSGQDGSFTLSNVPLGTVRLLARDERDPANIRQAERAVSLNQAGQTVEVLLEMPAQGTLTGVVRDSAGVPVPGLRVFAYGPRNERSTTNAQGEYRFPHMPVGQYTVAAFRPDFSDGNFNSGRLQSLGQTLALDIRFRARGSISGTVYDDDGVTPLGARVGLSEWVVVVGELRPLENPDCLPDIYVDGQLVHDYPDCEPAPVRWEYRQRARIVNSNVESGAFSFPNVFVGSFIVEAANPFSPGTVSVAGEIGNPGQSVNVTLSLQSTGIVSGTIFQPDGVTPVGRDVIVTMNAGYISNVRVVTDDSGNYRFPLVPAGGFSLTVEDPSSGLVARGTGAVQPGQQLTLSLRLLREGSVAVTVSGANGPVAGAAVTLTEGNYPNRRFEGVSGTDGTLIFSGGSAPVEGAFSVRAAKDGIQGSAHGSIPGVLQSPDGHVSVAIQLGDAAGTVQGRFLRSDGATPIPNAQISVSAGGRLAYTTTGAGGDFRFEGVLVNQNYSLQGYDPATGRRGIASGKLLVNGEVHNVDMVQVAQGTVTGSARWADDGSPVAAADVLLNSSGALGGSIRTTTSLSGAFTIPGVSAGNFSVSVTDPATGIRGLASGTLSQEGQTITLQLSLQRAPVGRVEGHVFRAEGGPAPFASVRLSGPRFGGASTTVDSQGFYRFENVPPGSYTVLATDQNSPDTGKASGELIAAGEVATIDVHFIGLGRVVGVVQSAATPPAPVAGARVDLSRDGSVIPPFYSATTLSGGDGTFTFEGVPVGQISLSTLQSQSGLAGSASGTIPGPGQTLTLTLVLDEAGTVRGRMLRESGEPAPQLALELKRSGSTLVRYGSTSDDPDTLGEWLFENVKLGSYTLNVTDPLGSGIASAAFTLDAQGQIIDLGDLRLDSAPPRVLTITPANGATSVPVTESIQVRFSEPVQPATVNNSTMPVTDPAGVVAGNWALNESGDTATFSRSTGPHPDLTAITVKVQTGVKDYAGRALLAQVTSTFTTGDSTPPAIASLSPEEGATGVALQAVVRVTFNEAIDPARYSALEDALIVRRAGERVAGAVALSFNNSVLIFTPAAPLRSDSAYEVTIAAATDMAGNPQSAATTYTFATLDALPPTILALTIAPDTTLRVGQSAVISAQLESAPDIALVEFFVDGVSRAVDQDAPYAFELPLTAEMVGEHEVGAQATDSSGNVSEARYATLLVVPDELPQVAISSPADGGLVDSGQHLIVTVQASDDAGLKKLFFQASGVVNTTTSRDVPDQATSYSWEIGLNIPTNATPGAALELRASATDSGDQSSDAVPVTVRVRDVTRPTVAFRSPPQYSLVEPGTLVPVVVRASDNGALAALTLTATGAATFNETRPISSTQSVTEVTFLLPVDPAANATQYIMLNAQATDAMGNLSGWRPYRLNIADIVDPQVTVTLPAGGAEVAPGQQVEITVGATDDIKLAALGLDISGVITETQSFVLPSQAAGASKVFVVVVPADAPEGGTIALVGTATDTSGNVGRSSPVELTVVAPSAETTVVGRVVDSGGQPVAGATVRVGELVATTELSGTFSLAGVPTVNGAIEVRAEATIDGRLYRGRSAPVEPVAGGETVVGDLLLSPVKLWDGGAGTNKWTTPANWSDDTLPGVTDDVLIPAGASVLLDSNAGVSVRSVAVDGALALRYLNTVLDIAQRSEVNGSLTIESGSVTGAGELLVNGTLQWQAGKIDGSGQLIIARAGRLSLVTAHGSLLTLGRSLALNGTTSWTSPGSSNLQLANSATITQPAGATLTANDRKTFSRPSGNSGSPRFVNEGTIQMLGTEYLTFATTMPFFNSGAVTVASGGTVKVLGGGTQSGTFTAASGTTLEFGGTVVLDPASSVASEGVVRLGNTSTSNISIEGGYVAATTTSGGGTSTFHQAGASPGTDLSLYNNAVMNFPAPFEDTLETAYLQGTLNLSSGAPVTFQSITIQQGGISGPDPLEVAQMTWRGGTVDGGGTFTITGSLTLDTGSGAILTLGRQLQLPPVTAWTNGGGASFRFAAGAQLVNPPGALFTLSDSKVFARANGVSASFTIDNAGTIQKLNGTGNSTLATGIGLSNRGTVVLGAGKFLFQGGFSQGAEGTLRVTGISGTTPGSQLPRVEVTGQATLDGVFQVARAASYQPTSGDHVIMTYGSRVGHFVTIEGLDIGNGYRFDPIYNSANLTLRVVP